MRLMLYLAAIIAMSPFVLAFAVLARAMRKPPSTPPLGTIGEIGYDDDDPGVDVDCTPCNGCTNAMCPCQDQW